MKKKKIAWNHFPQLFNLGKHVKKFWAWWFRPVFWEWAQTKKHSKIKPPLLVVIQTKVLWRKSFLFGLPTNLQVAFDSSHQLTDCKNLEVVEFSHLQPSLFKRWPVAKKLIQLVHTMVVPRSERQLNKFFGNRWFFFLNFLSIVFCSLIYIDCHLINIKIFLIDMTIIRNSIRM